MNKDSQNLLIGAGILLVALLLFGPQLGLFSSVPSNSISVSEDTYVTTIHPEDNYGTDNRLSVRVQDDGDLSWIYLKFDINPEMANLIRAGAEIDYANLYLYVAYNNKFKISIYETSNDWSEQTIDWSNKPARGNLITVKQIYSSDDESYIEITGIKDYVKQKVLSGDNQFSLIIGPDASETDEQQNFYSSSNSDGPYFSISLVQEYSCQENEIKQLEGDYFICKNSDWKLITDLIELTDDEQQAFLEQINLLQLTIEQKADIINNLSSTLDGQLILIEKLKLTIQEKADLINQLDLNIQEQTELISKMKLTVLEQAQIIDSLDLKIQQQADMINQLTQNLQEKAVLVEQLQVTNERQAELIADMKLSFSDQAGIIESLNNKISDDAQIIVNLHTNVNDQALLINELKLSNTELSSLVKQMNLSLQDDVILIDNLNLTIQQQSQIIKDLRLSVQQEEILVSSLKLTVEQQKQIIENLKSLIASSSVNSDATMSVNDLWDNYKIIILIVGGILLLLIFSGGGKR